MQRRISLQNMTTIFCVGMICPMIASCSPGGIGAGNGGGGGGSTTSGNCSGNGTGDDLSFLTLSGAPLTITILYPDNTTCIQTLNAASNSAGSTVITDTKFVENEVFTFNASAPGAIDAIPVECRVTADPVATGAANVSINMQFDGVNSQPRINCSGGGFEDITVY